ncbi:MAG: V-type ATPase subunit [Spirochaetaceae bacterium]|jgi:vacuolar-type H+-ATPase subunit C/Vma6|nr:V-type ATPase subunit [Spirochaetaceae bacterium]
MPGTGERAYAYAKACGIIGKSFVGKRVGRLAEVNRLAELDRLVFPQESRDLPERDLITDMENRIVQRAVRQIIAIIHSFVKPPELFRTLIRTYEYEDLKTFCGALAHGEPKRPEFTDIGAFRTVDFSAYPNLEAMIARTEFKFLLQENLRPDRETEKSEEKIPKDLAVQIALDRRYYRLLWDNLSKISRSDRSEIGKIIRDELSLRNAVLALRMRTYYGMPSEEIREKFIAPEDGKKSPAEAALAIPMDHRAGWKGWKWERFLNPEKPGEPWRADPRYFQNAGSKYLYQSARFSFRRSPSSLDSLFCFIKLKLFEEDLLTSVAEGLGMGMTSRDIFTLLEVET